MTPGVHAMSGCYRFGPFLLDPQSRRLRRGGVPVRATSKAFDLLVLLIEARDRVISRNEIFDRLWPDTAVEDNNLSQQVHRIRRLLGSDEAAGAPIATIPGRGFRFLWSVETHYPPAARPGPATDVVDAPSEIDGSRWPALLDRLVGREGDLASVQALVRAASAGSLVDCTSRSYWTRSASRSASPATRRTSASARSSGGSAATARALASHGAASASTAATSRSSRPPK